MYYLIKMTVFVATEIRLNESATAVHLFSQGTLLSLCKTDFRLMKYGLSHAFSLEPSC